MSGLSRRAFLTGPWSDAEKAPVSFARGPAVIGPECLALNSVVCRSCAERCETRAIRFRLAPGGVAVPLLRTERCNGCGACIPVCPTAAITLQATAPRAEAAA